MHIHNYIQPQMYDKNKQHRPRLPLSSHPIPNIVKDRYGGKKIEQNTFKLKQSQSQESHHFSIMNELIYHYSFVETIADLNRLNPYFYSYTNNTPAIFNKAAEQTINIPKIEVKTSSIPPPICDISGKYSSSSLSISSSKHTPSSFEPIQSAAIPDKSDLIYSDEIKNTIPTSKCLTALPTTYIITPTPTITHVASQKSKSSGNYTSTIQNGKFYPSQKNTMFWCIYIKYYGWIEYDNLLTSGNFLHQFSSQHRNTHCGSSSYANIEMNERSNIADYFKENPDIFRNSNIKLTKILLKELVSSTIADIYTPILCLYLFALYYKRWIFLINVENNTYIRFGSKSDDQEFEYNKDSLIPNVQCNDDMIIYFEPSNPSHKRFYIEPKTSNIYSRGNESQDQILNVTFTSRTEIENKYFELESIMRPIKSCSHYKVIELQEIAVKLGINIAEFKRKPELYQAIIERIVWKT